MACYAFCNEPIQSKTERMLTGSGTINLLVDFGIEVGACLLPEADRRFSPFPRDGTGLFQQTGRCFAAYRPDAHVVFLPGFRIAAKPLPEFLGHQRMIRILEPRGRRIVMAKRSQTNGLAPPDPQQRPPLLFQNRSHLQVYNQLTVISGLP